MPSITLAGRIVLQHPDLGSNQGLDLRKVQCYPATFRLVHEQSRRSHRALQSRIGRPQTSDQRSRPCPPLPESAQSLRHLLETRALADGDRRPVRASGSGMQHHVHQRVGLVLSSFQWTDRELNPVSVLTTDVCCRNTYRPILSSDPGWNRTCTVLHVTQASSPLDHGIVVSDRGRNRTCKFATLRAPTGMDAGWSVTALPVCVLGRKWRVRGSHPAVQAYEARMSTGPPAVSQVAGPGIEPDSSGL
jgi:hypothetical protein